MASEAGTSHRNFEPLTRSRTAPKEGDVFTMRVRSVGHLFGRVIRADPPRTEAPMPDAYLIYVYDIVRPVAEVDLDTLTPDRLLIPPIFINRRGWTMGHLRTIAHAELRNADLLNHHCFRDFMGRHRDKKGQILPEGHEPCGAWDLSSDARLDDLVSDALGIARARGEEIDERPRSRRGLAK